MSGSNDPALLARVQKTHHPTSRNRFDAPLRAPLALGRFDRVRVPVPGSAPAFPYMALRAGMFGLGYLSAIYGIRELGAGQRRVA
jgi:hypothetical protein